MLNFKQRKNYTIFCASQLPSERRSEVSSAAVKLAIATPATKLETHHSRSAFNTKENSPKVMSVTGSVSTKRIGRIMRFTTPNTSPAISALYPLSTITPGIYTLATTKRSAVITMRVRMPIMNVV